MKRKIVAVTGGIGSGKSEVGRILRQMGYQTVDCDALAKEIANEPEVIAAVERLLGSDSVQNGAINRQKVRETVFTDAKLLQKYDEIFFERVRQRLVELSNGARGALFVEIAVIDAFDFPFDEIWLVESRKSTRIDRVTARDNVSAENVEHIMERQRYPKFTRLIDNDGTLEQLKKQVLSCISDAQIV